MIHDKHVRPCDIYSHVIYTVMGYIRLWDSLIKKIAIGGITSSKRESVPIFTHLKKSEAQDTEISVNMEKKKFATKEFSHCFTYFCLYASEFKLFV